MVTLPRTRVRNALAAAAQRLGDARRHEGGALPPGPVEPALVQTLEWALAPLGYLERARARYGRVFTCRFTWFPPLVSLSDPEIVREVFTGSADLLHAGEANAVLKPLLGVHSLLLLDGEAHLRQRRLLLPPFHGQRMLAYGEAMRAVTERAIAGWPRGRPFAVHAKTQAIALDVILKTVFGMDDDGAARELHAEFTGLFEAASANPLLLLPALQRDLGPLTPWGAVVRRIEAIDRRLFALVAERQREAARPGRRARDDVLALLVDARDEEGRPMSAAELRDELMTLLVAGHDTVATALAWTFHHLTESPAALERAQREVDERWDARAAEAERAVELPWIDAVVKEALRLTPVLPVVARRLQADVRIGGIELPKGVRAAPNVYLTHRDPELWPDPARFDPERFVGARPSPHAFFPFGGGLRRCIGMAFALFEMRVVLATVLRRLEVRRAPGARVRAVRHGIALAPSEGMPVIVSDRR